MSAERETGQTILQRTGIVVAASLAARKSGGMQVAVESFLHACSYVRLSAEVGSPGPRLTTMPTATNQPFSSLQLLRLDRTDFDVTEGNLAVITLQSDRAFAVLGEVFHLAELALRDAAVETFTAQHVIKILHAIDDVLALLRRDDNAHMIPFSDGLGGVERHAGFRICRRLIKGIEPTAALRIFGSHVVLKLNLRACAPNRLGRLGDVIHDAAVARVRVSINPSPD